MQTRSLGPPPANVCVARLSAIGDTCHALAVVRNLQDNWPDTRISWIIGRREAALLGDIAGVDFITFDKREGRAAYRSVLTALEDEHFDVALCMHASLRVNLLYPRLPAARRLGFDKARARDFQYLFTNERIRAAPGEHALDAMLGFARHLGAEPKPVRWDIPLAEGDRAFAAEHADTRTVVVSPLSSERRNNYRNWPLERYRAVCEHLTGTHGLPVVVTGGGGANERRYAAALSELGGVTSLVGKTSLKELLAVLERSAFVICPDSGPVHMATAVGTPVVGLYATSNPRRTGPYCQRQWTVDRYPDAVARYLGKSPRDLRWGRRVRHPEAMELIAVEDVIDRIDALVAADCQGPANRSPPRR